MVYAADSTLRLLKTELSIYTLILPVLSQSTNYFVPDIAAILLCFNMFQLYLIVRQV